MFSSAAASDACSEGVAVWWGLGGLLSHHEPVGRPLFGWLVACIEEETCDDLERTDTRP